VALPGLAGTYLCRVDLGPGQSVADVAALDVPVLHEFEGYCLVRVAEERLPALTGNAFAVQVLDHDPEARLYHYVSPQPGLDRALVQACGTILTSDQHGLLLRTDPDAMLELNRLPVELCGISMEPMSFGEPAPPVPQPVSESLVQSLVARVNQDSLLSHIDRLVGFYTRYSTTESCRRAVEWVQTRFQGWNCDSTALETFRSGYAPNVIGCKFGTVNRRPIWVICGHADNTSDYAPSRCPGSDDNASGTAAVIEACRVLAEIEFDQTVYFIGFSGEEQGLYGSDSFTRRASRRGDSIKAALNFDMISYGRQNIDTFEVIGKTSNPNCYWLVDSFIANARRYTALKTHRSMVSGGAAYSDHYYFWQRGWPAFCGIEQDFTPMYHTIGDTVGPLYYANCGTNNVPMATEAVKAAVATLAKFAGAHVPTGAAEPRRRPLPAAGQAVLTVLGRPPITVVLPAPPAPGTRLDIFDAAGARIRTLAASGPRLTWDGRAEGGRRVPAGSYLLRLSGPAAASTGRVLLFR
jgi:hypothetical protein